MNTRMMDGAQHSSSHRLLHPKLRMLVAGGVSAAHGLLRWVYFSRVALWSALRSAQVSVRNGVLSDEATGSRRRRRHAPEEQYLDALVRICLPDFQTGPERLPGLSGDHHHLCNLYPGHHRRGIVKNGYSTWILRNIWWLLIIYSSWGSQIDFLNFVLRKGEVEVYQRLFHIALCLRVSTYSTMIGITSNVNVAWNCLSWTWMILDLGQHYN